MTANRAIVSRMLRKLPVSRPAAVSSRSDGITEVNVDKRDLPDVCRFLGREEQGRLFVVTGSDERDVGGFLSVYYVFAFDRLRHFVAVKADIDENDPTFPSVTPELPAANWYEREMKDLLGLRPIGHPDPRPLILHGDWPEELHPLRKEFPAGLHVPRVKSRETFPVCDGEDITVIPVGPIHAGIIEPGHFRFAAVGETILHLDTRLFYTHRGLEKASEGWPLEKAVAIAERVCGVCALSHATAYCQAVETAAGADIPERAKQLRTLFLEMERIYNHVGDIGNICAGVGFAVGASHGARLKEELLRLNERAAGHRYLRGLVVPGGMRRDADPDALDDVRFTLRRIGRDFREFVDMIAAHGISVDRMRKTGTLSKEHADRLETVGVAARASGRNIDARRDWPYAAYASVRFDVPVFREGDVWARVRVRAEETFQSLSIAEQILDRLTPGEIAVPLPDIPPYRWAMGWTESPRGETVHWLMTGENGTIYRYRIRSATYSNWPAVSWAVRGNIVPDFPLINKSFELCYACCDR